VLADQFYLIAHEDRTGRSRLHPRATGLGLTASRLGTFALDNDLRIIASDPEIIRNQPPSDGLNHSVLELLVAQPQHRDVRTWLSHLSQDAADRLEQGLDRSGVAESVIRRRMPSTQTFHTPGQRTAAQLGRQGTDAAARHPGPWSRQRRPTGREDAGGASGSAQPDIIASALARNRLGVPSVVFFGVTGTVIRPSDDLPAHR
jgi:hypothetical protein